MCNNTQKKKGCRGWQRFYTFFGVMLHFNFKYVAFAICGRRWQMMSVKTKYSV